jgi:probable HAF family extracellular repeat protein
VNGVVDDLGTFPKGGGSYPLDINRFGHVVGAAYLDTTGVGNFRAFVYSDGTGLRNLNHLIDPALGWVLREATGINDRGQIVGWGYRDGKDRPFRLSPSFRGLLPEGWWRDRPVTDWYPRAPVIGPLP